MRLFPILTLVALVALFQACGNDERPIPDVDHLEAPLQVDRFDHALFQADTNNFRAALVQINEDFPSFTPLFAQQLMQVGPIDDPTPAQVDYLRGFITTDAFRFAYDTTQIVFPDLAAVTQELQQALRYFRHYFPDRSAPTKLTTFHAAFNYSAIIFGENELAVALEYYLGKDFPYERLNSSDPVFSSYLVRTYNRDHLVPDLVRVIVEDLVGQAAGSKLLDVMIHNGKKRYLVDLLLPHASDTVKSEVTLSQWEWLEDNEFELYTYLKSENLLYSTRYQDFRKLVEPSPNGAPLLPEEAPGEAANYLGFRIVSTYMDKHPELSPEDLLLERDAQRILEGAKYKPRR